MEKQIIYAENFDINLKSLLDHLHIDEDDDYIEEIREMREQALKIARPVAIFMKTNPEFLEGKTIINGVQIDEPFVYEKLSQTCTAIPYVASCGVEIDEWAHTFTDVFLQFVADHIKQMLLTAVTKQLASTVKATYFPDEKFVSALNPGSLKEWGLSGQIPLFKILGGVTADIGVKLSDSLLMSPNKSVSGIYFRSDSKYENCQLCPRTDCPGRRAAYLQPTN